MKLVIATKNTNKVREIRDKLGKVPEMEILSLFDVADIPDIVEDGADFAETPLKRPSPSRRPQASWPLPTTPGL